MKMREANSCSSTLCNSPALSGGRLCEVIPTYPQASFASVAGVWTIAGILGLLWGIIFSRCPVMVQEWSGNEMVPLQGYSALAISLLALWRRHPLLAQSCGGGSYLWVTIGILLLLWIWTTSLMPHVKHYIFLAACAAIFGGAKGWTGLRLILPSLLILVYVAALPSEITQRLIEDLQIFAATVGQWFGQTFLSKDIFRSGIMLFGFDTEFPSFQRGIVVVAPQCSGYRSLFGLSMISLLFAADRQLGISRKILLFLGSLALAIACNLLRIVAALCVRHFYTYSIEGLSHSLLGIALMLLELIILFCVYISMTRGIRRRNNT